MSFDTDAVVVGFDLGHGETALALARTDSTAAPTVLDLPGASRRQHVTAVGRTPSGEVVIGEEAIRADDVRPPWLGFKNRTLTDPDTREPMRLFIERVVADLLESGQIADPHKVHWVFGTPSGWSATDRTRYEELLAEVGLAGATVIAESRAALLYARDSGEITVSKRNKRITQRVVVTDIGSSTTDHTAVSELSARPAIDRGNVALGASLIDKEIMRLVTNRYHGKDELLEILAINPHLSRRLELECRDTKEKFFRQRHSKLAERGARVGGLYPFELPDGAEVHLDLRLSIEDMDAVLDAGLAELGGRSWRQAFRDDVTAAIDSVPGGVDLVLLTGGPSRMKFVFDTCAELVGADRVALGSEPEFAIARGLALAGRTSIRGKSFRLDLAKVEKQIGPTVANRIPELADAVGTAVAKDVTERHVIPAFLAWRHNKIRTLDDMVRTIADGVNADIDPDNNMVVAELNVAWQNRLRAELHNITRPVCNRWHIDSDALNLPTLTVTTSAQVDKLVNADDMTRDMNTAANAVNAVIAAVVAMTLFGGGFALIATTGPVAVVFAFLVGAGILAVGKDEAMKKMKGANVWPSIRKLGSEKSMLTKLRAKAAANEAELARSLADDLAPKFAAELTEQVTKNIISELHYAADQAELLIR